MERVLIIFGEHTADEVRSAAERFANCTGDPPWSRIEKCYFDHNKATEIVRDIGIKYPSAFYHVGIADNVMRREAALAAESIGLTPLSIIDPGAFVDPTAKIEPGCFVAAHSVISAEARLARHCLVHFNATVGHNTTVGEFSSVLPGARLSGFVQTGSGVMIGSNAFVFQGVKVGNDAKVDALTYVRVDVPERRVISGRRFA
jgi:UDP-3-O-[3-hydroxymyristoyl] glucosamine N-acyltransferase